jgi:vacuolar protein-sorting-associated protein 4
MIVRSENWLGRLKGKRSLTRFSGSDVSTFVKQACYEPLRKTTEATYFKQIPGGQWTACSSSDHGAVPKTMKDFTDPNALVPPTLEYVG